MPPTSQRYANDIDAFDRRHSRLTRPQQRRREVQQRLHGLPLQRDHLARRAVHVPPRRDGVAGHGSALMGDALRAEDQAGAQHVVGIGYQYRRAPPPEPA